MHYSGHEVISLATQRSWRAVIGLSCVILSVWYFDVQLDNFTVFEIKFQKGAIDTSLLAFNILFLVSYIFSWLGDWVSVGHWNKSDGDDGRSKRLLEESPDVHVKDILNELERQLKQNRFTSDQCNSLVKRLEKLDRKYNHRAWYFRFYFYFWYLAFPLIMSILAVYLWFDWAQS